MPTRNPYVCLAIVLGLIVVAVIGISGLVVVNVMGQESPRDVLAVVSTVVGSLSSFLVTVPRGSVGTDQEEKKK